MSLVTEIEGEEPVVENAPKDSNGGCGHRILRWSRLL